MLEAVDRRTALGKRVYAILLLLVTYGLRSREVAALTLEDLNWERANACGSRSAKPDIRLPTLCRRLLEKLFWVI